MAVPKRRQSRSRSRKRRSAEKVTAVKTSVCPQCKSVKLPHRICGECGYYGSKEIVKSEFADKQSKKKAKKEK